MFLVESDKLDIKRHLCGFLFIVHYYIISRFNGKNIANQRKADAVLFELADVANAL